MKFISFLGTGQDDEGYSELDYKIDGREGNITTEFVQRAEIEFIGKDQFEKIYILCTDESKDFFHDLNDELRDDLNIPVNIIESVNIGKIDKIQSAWALFEKVSSLIHDGDTLVFDLTHGFRSLSIILSTALNYILKSKENLHLKHVFYGEKEQASQSKGRIIDMKDFYTVHEWADGVSRLTESADATKIAGLAAGESNDTFQNLKDERFVNVLNVLTETLKNIDVNRIARNTTEALEIIKSYQNESSGTEKELLKLIEKKFQPLAVHDTGKYDGDYFILQIQIVRMLNRHNLYMQSFTVIRELIGSIGMLGAPERLTQNILDNMAANQRFSYADLFVRMMNFRNFKTKTDNEQARYDELHNSICRRIDQLGLLEDLKDMTKRVLKARNGFDHAWTGKGDEAMNKMGDIEKLAHEAEAFFDRFLKTLVENNIIKEG